MILIFFILSALIIASNNDIGLYEKGNTAKFSELYFGWLNNVYKNGQTITGYITGMDWFPK